MKSCFVTLVLLLTCVCVFAQAPSKGNTNEKIGSVLPQFRFTDIDGKTVTPAVLPQNQPVVVFYFDPECDHCQMVASWITSQKTLFKEITMVWVSWAEIADIKAFPGKHLPGVAGDIYFTKDTEFKFDNYFGYSEVPSIYVYNSAWKRTASFKEETKPEILVKFARQQ